jgi:molybdenum cofactor biosynthesis enzyme
MVYGRPVSVSALNLYDMSKWCIEDMSVGAVNLCDMSKWCIEDLCQ